MNALSRARLFGAGLTALPIDVNGIPDGPDYDTFLKVGDMRAEKSVRAGKCGVWSGRQHHVAGLDEISAFRRLEGNPVVLSIREGYPLFPEHVLQSADDGAPINRSAVMTIDFVLTLPPFNFGGPLRYIGLSLKKTYMRRTPKGVRRGQREQSNLGRIGWGWKYLDLSNPEEAAADFNHNMLVDWANSPHNESIDAFEREAAALGAALYQTSSKKPLGALLAMLGRRLGIKESLQLHVFACAYYLGYIQLSHSEELGLSRPLNLAPPARRFGGAYVRR